MAVKLNNTKTSCFWLKGSIVEPVVAIVILVMAIAMAFTILTRLNLVPELQAKNKANEVISNEIANTFNNKELLDKEEQFGGLMLTKTVYQGQKIIEIELAVYDTDNKEIAVRKLLVTDRQLFGLNNINKELSD